MSGFREWPVALRRGAERRSERRLAVEIEDAFLREPGHRRARVTVRDLSLHGFRTEWHYRLRPGATLWLTLPGLGAESATVARASGFEIGCRFDRPLHPAVLEGLAQSFPCPFTVPIPPAFGAFEGLGRG